MEEEKKVEVLEEKKKNNGLGPGFMVVLVVLFLVGGVLGFAASKILDEPVKKDNTEAKEKKKEEKEPVVTTYAVTDEKVANLIKNIDIRGGSVGNCNTIEFYVNDKKVEVNDIPNLMAYHMVEASLNGGSFQNMKQSITLDEFNKEIQKYLGKDYKFDPASVDYNGGTCPQYSYDANTKTFNKQDTACGWTCGPMTSYRAVKAVDTDGVLKIDVKVIFQDYGTAEDKSRDGYYSDYKKTNKIGTFEDNREALYDKGSNYQFTFKLEDGNYVFVSSEPVK